MRQSRFVPASFVPFIFPHLLFLLSSLIAFPRYSLLDLSWYQTKIHFYGRWRQGFYPSCHLCGFILHLDLLSKHLEGKSCSCSLGLPPYISHRGLSNALFVFYSLTSFPCHCLAQSQIQLSGGEQIYNYLILTVLLRSSTYRFFRLVRLEKIAAGS